MRGIAPVQSHICQCCGAVSKEPEWSERVNDQQMVYIWRCVNCSYYFETREKCFGHEPSAAELAEEFLPKLVVE